MRKELDDIYIALAALSQKKQLSEDKERIKIGFKK